jgi:hypothetical protein
VRRIGVCGISEKVAGAHRTARISAETFTVAAGARLAIVTPIFMASFSDVP